MESAIYMFISNFIIFQVVVRISGLVAAHWHSLSKRWYCTLQRMKDNHKLIFLYLSQIITRIRKRRLCGWSSRSSSISKFSRRLCLALSNLLLIGQNSNCFKIPCSIEKENSKSPILKSLTVRNISLAFIATILDVCCCHSAVYSRRLN